MNYELIISDIKNYKRLQNRLIECKNEITGIDHTLYGIHGGSFDDVIVNGKDIRQYYHGGYITEEAKAQRSEALNRLKKRYEDEIDSINCRLDQVRFVLANIPNETKEIIASIYWGKGWKYTRYRFHRSNSSMQRQIRKDIEAL